VLTFHSWDIVFESSTNELASPILLYWYLQVLSFEIFDINNIRAFARCRHVTVFIGRI